MTDMFLLEEEIHIYPKYFPMSILITVLQSFQLFIKQVFNDAVQFNRKIILKAPVSHGSNSFLYKLIAKIIFEKFSEKEVERIF